MSLALADQKLGSHSNADSTSHKFMLKGRQSGGMHRGHAWVFRAESYDTMMAWFSDIRNLTEKTGAERSAFIQRSHARSLSTGSHKAGSISSDGMEEDEADQVPYSATPSQADISAQQEKLPDRPTPGGRFPSALLVDRGSHVPLSPSSNESSGDQEIVAAAGALPGSGVPFGKSGHQVQVGDDETNATRRELAAASGAPLPNNAFPLHQQQSSPLPAGRDVISGSSPQPDEDVASFGAPHEKLPINRSLPHHVERHDSKYGDWIGPAAAGVGGGAIGAVGIEAYRNRDDDKGAAPQAEHLGLQTVEPQASSVEVRAAQPPVAHPVQGGIFAAIPASSTVNNTTTVHTKDPADPIKVLADATERPTLASRVDTISDLHLPGEFPRGKSLADPS